MSIHPDPIDVRVPSLSFGSAVRAFIQGIGFIIGTPAVWIYAAVPAGMMVLLTLAFGSLGIWAANWGTNAILGEVTNTWGHIEYWTLTVVFVVLGLLFAVVLALSLAQPLSCFALEKIVHAQERALTGRHSPAPPLLISMFLTFKVSLAALLLGGPILALLFFINLLFPPATVVTVPLKLLVVGWLLAWDFLDYPLGLRRHGLRQRCRWVWRNFEAFTVYGLLWAFLVIVPGVVLLLLPMGVAGATWLVVADERTNSPLAAKPA